MNAPGLDATKARCGGAVQDQRGRNVWRRPPFVEASARIALANAFADLMSFLEIQVLAIPTRCALWTEKATSIAQTTVAPSGDHPSRLPPSRRIPWILMVEPLS